MEGTVKFFNRGRGFGFVAGDDGNEYFVHATGLKEGVDIKEGDRVTFDPAEGDRGPKAENVVPTGENVPVGEAAEAPAEESEEEPAEESEEEPAEEAEEEEEEAPAEESEEEPAEEAEEEEAPAEEEEKAE
ncbi:MAG: cold shock domain-containing protein [Candidatus Altiarchaeota archaeon]|nr:cold shock domain-containing protein [Candidatus Altiarchaeota archaeon]